MKKVKNIIISIIRIILIVIIIFSLVMIIKWFISTRKNNKLIEKINTKINIDEIRDGKVSVDFDYLKSINSDTVGYISIEGLDINYPVVQTSDNDYYLNHSFDKSKSSTGSIFMDYRNNSMDDRNTVIYGHNMKDGSMFGKLKSLKNMGSTTIYYYENNNTYIFKVFSIYEIDAEDYYTKTNISDTEYLDFLNTLKERSINKYDYNPSLEDKILTLSTCSSSKRRLVVHAALLVD